MAHIFSYTVLDSDGNQRAVPVYATLLGTLTLTQIQAISVALSAVLDPILDGQIIKGSLTVSLDLDTGIKTSPVAESNVQESGLLTFNVTGSDYAWSIDIPAFDQASFSGKVINLTAAEVVDFTNFVTTTASGFTATDKYDNALQSVRAGKKTFRK